MAVRGLLVEVGLVLILSRVGGGMLDRKGIGLKYPILSCESVRGQTGRVASRARYAQVCGRPCLLLALLAGLLTKLRL